jgi:hypothetical protein
MEKESGMTIGDDNKELIRGNMEVIKEKILQIQELKGPINFHKGSLEFFSTLKKENPNYTDKTFDKSRIYHLLIGSTPPGYCEYDDLPGEEFVAYVISELKKLEITKNNNSDTSNEI